MLRPMSLDTLRVLPRRVHWVNVLQVSAFALLLFGIKLWLIHTYGNATPYWDQWDSEAVGLYKPFLEGTLHWTDFLAPHNEHRIVMTRLLSLALLIVNGIWNPLMEMLVNAGLHVVTLIFGIALLARVLGRNHLPVLLTFSVVLFGVPYAWANTLAGFQSQFYFVVLFSIASLWLTVTSRPLSARWWLGIACAVLAFFSLASGALCLASSAVVGCMFLGLNMRRSVAQVSAVVILLALFVLGCHFTPALPQHAFLKATSPHQFFESLLGVLGWPIAQNFLSAIIRNLPAFAFAGVLLWKRPSVDDRRWFLLALVVWVLGQALSVAYVRAIGSLSSRYLDLYANAILVNFACLMAIAQDHVAKRRGVTIAVVFSWIAAVLVSLGIYGMQSVPVELAAKRDSGREQESNTRDYLATGDMTNLRKKPDLQVPYPNAEVFASILASPTVRAILPSNIRPALRPTSTSVDPSAAFVAKGYYPTTPDRDRGMTLGSYGAQGNEATGQASWRFGSNVTPGIVEIPVAGYPLNGNKLELEQGGRRTPIVLEDNPYESWKMARAKVRRGAFSIVLTDDSTSYWLAIGAPVMTGRLDATVNRMLATYPMFIMLGLVAAVWLVTPTMSNGASIKRGSPSSRL